MTRLNRSLTIEGIGSSLSFKELRDFVTRAGFADVPNTARVTLRTSPGDRPQDQSMWSLAILWTEQTEPDDDIEEFHRGGGL